ncbi:MAG TPA: phenylalanine--tRNA ligase subunit beta [Fimbriimonas sp.]|nr:phenylalanine--tRNA ligase subunit beta [Fimbriimonas sp.]
MKFPYMMLRDFVDTKLTAQEIGDLLTMAGFELEGIEQVGSDFILDIKVMSNRGDGLSVFGLAREVLAKDGEAIPTELYNRAANRFADQSVVNNFEINDLAAIQSDSCRRFAVRAFEGVDGTVAAPDWIRDRLEASGVRSISFIVDLTNYVMLELGQPLHAFDRAKLSGGRLCVRHAAPGEKLTTLNGIEHELEGQMMICDGSRPVGVPGVMGGLDTEVTDGTTSLLLESANFVNTVVRKTRKQLGLATEASYRFERSVDPDGVVAATHRFTELLLATSPNVTVSNIIDLYPGSQTLPRVDLRVDRACMLLGLEFSAEQAHTYLERLGMNVTRNEGVLSVVPPSWRPDIVREEDLVEELGRVHGYERIPEWNPAGESLVGGSKGKELLKDKLREAFYRAGLVQTISHSLRSEHPLDEPCERIGPRNPGSPETSVLRSSLLPGLADAFRRNGARDLHLFEVGKVFYKWEGEYFETYYAAWMMQGALVPAARQGEVVPKVDFFAVKAVFESICATLSVQGQFKYEPLGAGVDARFHPTRSAVISIDGEHVGTIGQIHPDVAKESGLEADTFICELAWDNLANKLDPSLKIKNISRNPATRRDIAILIDKSVAFSSIEEKITEAGGDLLEKHWLFDVFEGTGIPEGKHSLGIGFQLRKQGENFTDEEANQVRDRIVSELESLGATLR